MTDTESESSDSSASRLARLEERLRVIERDGAGRGIAARALRFLPLLALGNLFVAAPALVISGAVAYFAFEQAEATKKMQIGSVWPNVSYDTGNLDDAGNPQISLNVANRGVGPARIAGMQLSLDGKAYRSIPAMVRDCCLAQGEPLKMVLSAVNGEVISPGDEVAFVTVSPDGLRPSTYERLDNARLRVRTQVCYCSVFDDCWIEDSQETAVRPVAQCPADWLQYGFPNGVKPAA